MPRGRREGSGARGEVKRRIYLLARLVCERPHSKFVNSALNRQFRGWVPTLNMIREGNAMSTLKAKTSAVVAFAFSIAAASTASANCSPGFLADVACDLGIINQSTANDLDGVHAAIGRPLDNLARPFNNPPGSPARPQVAFGQPQVALGNICYTQAGPVAGPFNPIGSACRANTAWGMIPGVVGR